MVDATRALDHETIDQAIDYVAELPPLPVAPGQLKGNVGHGEYLYRRNCSVCHGNTGKGSLIEAEVPRLDLQRAWYLERELGLFRNQQRGFHPDDTIGKVMGFCSQLLPDEQAVRDVVLWLTQASESSDIF